MTTSPYTHIPDLPGGSHLVSEDIHEEATMMGVALGYRTVVGEIRAITTLADCPPIGTRFEYQGSRLAPTLEMVVVRTEWSYGSAEWVARDLQSARMHAA